jgi:hypothetical protein
MSLGAQGLDVSFFTSMPELESQMLERRAGIILVSEQGDKDKAIETILQIARLPETTGARIILDCDENYDDVLFLAACSNFRDLIPSSLPDELWLQRVFFAAAGKPVTYDQPQGQISAKSIAALHCPARITLMSRQFMRIECRVTPPVGTTLQLHGSLARELGLTSLGLIVKNTQQSRLSYRFSDALTCEFRLPDSASKRFESMLEQLNPQSATPRFRVFLIAKDSQLRRKIISQMNPQEFDVNLALQAQSIMNEANYFSPHLVIIEKSLFFEKLGYRYASLIDSLPKSTPILILDNPILKQALTINHDGRTILHISQVNSDLAPIIKKECADLLRREQSESEPHTRFINSELALSYAHLSLPARINRIHPQAVQLSIPYRVGKFALVQLHSPFVKNMIGFHPWLKITDHYQNGRLNDMPFVHTIDTYFANASRNEYANIATNLSNILEVTFREFGGSRTGQSAHLSPPPLTSSEPRRQVQLKTTTQELPKEDEKIQREELPAAKIANIVDPDFDTDLEDIRLDIVRRRQDRNTKRYKKPLLDRMLQSFESEDFKLTMKFIFFAAITFTIIYTVAGYLARDYKKSGQIFTEQLLKYAPHMKDRGETKPDQGP